MLDYGRTGRPLEVFLKTEDLSALKDEYNRNCVTCGHEIRVLEPGHEYTGMTDGINDLGELVVKKADGETVCVYAGEVSVRGIDMDMYRRNNRCTGQSSALRSKFL